jgi:DNA end-binding protein Ku
VWELIHAKLENRAPEIVTEEPGGAKVINIMDALKKSVQQGKGSTAKSGGKKAAPRASAKKTARTPKRKSA